MVNDVSSLEIVHQAYRRLTHSELVIFLHVRNLPTTGTDLELASRLAQHDLHTYHFPTENLTSTQSISKQRPPISPDLPIEIIAYILDQLGDWELTKAVGVPTSLPVPLQWTKASATDHAMILGRLPLIRIRLADACTHSPTSLGAICAIRFGYVHVLEFLLTQHRNIFDAIFKDDVIPIKASRHGRTTVLSWWQEKYPQLIPAPLSNSIADAIEGASRNGHVASLDWWLHSGICLEYSDTALEYASAKNQIEVLEWWKIQSKTHRLPLKIGRVMEMASKAGHVKTLEWWAASQLEFKYDRHALQHASYNGKVEVLEWWLGSGLQLVFDQDVLTGATRHNRPEVLQWWVRSGLPVQYRVCDIEEALEDAIGGGDAAREWWRKKGVDFNGNDKEWTKLQYLNS